MPSVLSAAPHLAPRVAEILASLPARLAATVESVWSELASTGRLRDGAEKPMLTIPPSFGEMLAATVALDEEDGGASPEAIELRLRTYTEFMPRLRIEQLASSERVASAIFHGALDWSRLPRLSSVVDGFYRVCEEADVAPEVPLGAPSASAFRAAFPTLATLYRRTHYGGFMPLLNAYPADLAAMGNALDAGATVDEVIDRHLAAPLAHELAHGHPSRRALFPPYLDECIAGWLGVVVLPDFAFPAPGETNAIFAAPWLAQVGQAMARAFGERAIVRAHLGADSWSDVLPAGMLDTFARWGWQIYRRDRAPHFLSSTYHPEPWLKLVFLGEPRDIADVQALAWRDIPVGDESALDEVMLRDALQAMCLDERQVDGAYRVGRRAPPRITIDVDACRVSAPARQDGLALAPPAYLLPPAVAARLRRAGVAAYTATLTTLDALPSLARAILDGATTGDGAGYRLVREPPLRGA